MEQGLDVVHEGVFKVESGRLKLEGDLRKNMHKAEMRPVDFSLLGR